MFFQAPAPAPEPPKPVQKAPIPAEHQVLQDVFEKLAKQCLDAAPNAVSHVAQIFLKKH